MATTSKEGSPLFSLTALRSPESTRSGKGAKGRKEHSVFRCVGRLRAALEKPGGDGTESVPIRRRQGQLWHGKRAGIPPARNTVEKA